MSPGMAGARLPAAPPGPPLGPENAPNPTHNGAHHPAPHPEHPAAQHAPGRRTPLGGRALRRWFGAYYVATVGVALTGQVNAGVHWSGYPWWGVAPVVAVIEFGGIMMAAQAEERWQKGERAIPELSVSLTVAAGATALNYFAHAAIGQPIAAHVFSGLTALGYTIWLIRATARRRDVLRDKQALSKPGPAYPWRRRLAHPRYTRLAQELWRRGRGRLDAEDAWDLAKITLVVRRETRLAVGRGGWAEVALRLWDAGRIAELAQARVDHEAMAELIVERISPERITAAITRTGRRGPWWRRAAERPLDKPTARRTTERATSPADQPAPPAAPPPAPPLLGNRANGERTRVGRTNGLPTVEQLTAFLNERHPVQRLNRETAAAALRDKFGSCSDARVEQARKAHNERLGAQPAQTGLSAQPGEGA